MKEFPCFSGEPFTEVGGRNLPRGHVTLTIGVSGKTPTRLIRIFYQASTNWSVSGWHLLFQKKLEGARKRERQSRFGKEDLPRWEKTDLLVSLLSGDREGDDYVESQSLGKYKGKNVELYPYVSTLVVRSQEGSEVSSSPPSPICTSTLFWPVPD